MTTNQLIQQLVTDGGAIVSSSDCSEIEITNAQATGRFSVREDGMGFVLRSKEWLSLQLAREKAHPNKGGRYMDGPAPSRVEGMLVPANHGFAATNEFVHDMDVSIEELKWAMLGMATHFEKVQLLLTEAAEHMADCETAPSDDWWKRYLEIDGAHMVLTEEGWEPAQLFFDMEESELLDFKDEVNAPEGKALLHRENSSPRSSSPPASASEWPASSSTPPRLAMPRPPATATPSTSSA